MKYDSFTFQHFNIFKCWTVLLMKFFLLIFIKFLVCAINKHELHFKWIWKITLKKSISIIQTYLYCHSYQSLHQGWREFFSCRSSSVDFWHNFRKYAAPIFTQEFANLTNSILISFLANIFFGILNKYSLAPTSDTYFKIFFFYSGNMFSVVAPNRFSGSIFFYF